MSVEKAWSNVLRGCAYGDAWGHWNEFKKYEELTGLNPRGPDLPAQLFVTDDTQMTLALARALNGAAALPDDALRANVIDEWIEWLDDPDNNRAPGNTCLSAVGRLKAGADWTDAMVLHSDGCGTVMRVSPVAFLPDPRWQGVAAWQAASTHGAALGIAASIMTAALIRFGAFGKVQAGHLLRHAIHLCFDARLRIDVDKWLEGHPTIFGVVDLDDGFAALHSTLQRAQFGLAELKGREWDGDPCDFGGQGWRAHECVATALLCADLFPRDPIEALRRATVTGGDSDSIAAVAGAILGAVHDNPWPAEWFDRLEPRYRQWILQAEGYVFDGGQSNF